jgi:hypothetical protein
MKILVHTIVSITTHLVDYCLGIATNERGTHNATIELIGQLT